MALTTKELEALSKQQQDTITANKSQIQEGQMFLIDIGEGGKKLAQYQGGKLISLGFKYPSDWQGKTIGAWQNETTGKALSSLGIDQSKIIDLTNDANYLWRDVIKDIPQTSLTDLEQFKSKLIDTTSGKDLQELPDAPSSSGTTEEKTTYADLENRDGTIYNTKTGKGYATPSALASDMGISPNDIKWDRISSEKIGYEDLENQNGTIVNTKTGKQYQNPQELASDLDILPNQIDWGKVTEAPTTPNDTNGTTFPTTLYKPDGTAVQVYDQNNYNNLINAGYTTTAPDAGGDGDGGDNGGGGTDPNVDMAGWSQDMIDVFTNLTDMLEAQIAQGNTVSPDIDIDETTLAGFLTQAQKELDPYYGSVIQMATQDLSDTLRYRQESFDLSAQQAERQYGEQLEGVGVGAAERGFAFSGVRQEQERKLAQGTQEAREQARRDLLYQTSGLGTAAERMLGSTSLSGMNFGTIAGAPNITAGQAGFQRTGTTPLYQLSGGITGELEQQRTVAESLRSSELESAYRANRGEDYSNY